MKEYGISEIVCLMADITKKYQKWLEGKAQMSGITASTAKILFLLLEKDDVSQLTLVKETGLKAPTISLVLQNVEGQGLISRKNDENDMRVTRVSLTDKGRDCIEKLKNDQEVFFEEKISDFTPQEKETMIQLLQKYLQAWE